MKRIVSFALVLAMALSLAACGGKNTAASMHLRRTQGTVSVSNNSGKDVLPLDNMILYSGYGVGTKASSYAWIDLDAVKLTKLDQNSEAVIEQEGKALSIEVRSGSLFFNVTEPLEDDETMDIRTSTMLVGIRGTQGWVEDNGGLSRVYLLEGKVECSAGGQTVQVKAGEYAELTPDGQLTVKEFDEGSLPAFVREELDGDLPGGPGTGGGFPWPGTVPPVGPASPEPSETPEISLVPQGSPVASGDLESLTWTLYSNGVMVIDGRGLMEDFEYQKAPWWEYHNSITGLLVKDGVISIGKYAFDECENLAVVSFPAGFSSIGLYAFNVCSKLETVSFRGNGNDTVIEDFAFWNCVGLTSIYLPEGVTRIGTSAFRWCNKLTDIGLPASLTSLSPDAFEQCGHIKNVYYAGSEEDWNKIGRNQTNKLSSAEFHYNYNYAGN